MSRVQSYVMDQQEHLHQYKSPNSSSADSVPESFADLTNFNDKFSVTPKECARSSCLEELSKDPPSISKFFQRKPNKTAASILSNKTDHSTPRSKAAQSKNRSSEEPHRKRKRSTSSLDQYEAFTNTSFDTIYQLLKECHELNQLTPSKHHGIPNYSHQLTTTPILYTAA
ncbi:hypothetical protein BD408DRAFT_468895 [Parasitella parasitica]|nr:hypothetical protein BD408DRAFT_468895 [Parasitella parasitica]